MNIKNIATKSVNKIKKYSPQILMGLGITTGAAGVFFACKNTLKLNDVIAPHTEKLEEIEQKVSTEGYSDEYTEDDEKKEIGACYKGIVKEGAKLYAFPAALLTCSVVSFCSAYKVLNMRNESLAIAYGQLLGTFKDYRARVIDKFGVKADEECYSEATLRTVIDEETGEVITEAKNIDDSTTDVCFDQSNPNYIDNAEYNKDFIIRVQAMLNDMLHAQGVLTLNDARKALGFKPIPAGQTIGWYDNEDHVGVVDFGLCRNDDAISAFLNGECKKVWIRFNVDGYIIDKM